MRAKRVLIVDDALIMRKRIRDIAEEAGWQVAGEAKDGEEAVALYQQEKPDLVTLDIVMPKLDGVSALKQIIANGSPSARRHGQRRESKRKAGRVHSGQARSTLSSNPSRRPACVASSRNTSPAEPAVGNAPLNADPTKILVVDDSALYRQSIYNVLREVADAAVVGSAKNGVEALKKIEQLDPDLLTLDVQMPDMDGIRGLAGDQAPAASAQGDHGQQPHVRGSAGDDGCADGRSV